MWTKKQALKLFKQHILPRVIERFGKNDTIAIRQAWGEYTDDLCKNKDITLAQYESWSNPF